jgi:hypothetical protein
VLLDEAIEIAGDKIGMNLYKIRPIRDRWDGNAYTSPPPTK